MGKGGAGGSAGTSDIDKTVTIGAGGAGVSGANSNNGNDTSVGFSVPYAPLSDGEICKKITMYPKHYPIPITLKNHRFIEAIEITDAPYIHIKIKGEWIKIDFPNHHHFP